LQRRTSGSDGLVHTWHLLQDDIPIAKIIPKAEANNTFFMFLVLKSK